MRNVSRPAAHEDALDEFVKLAHSTLSVHARMTLQGRAVFDEPVPDEALAFVLAPEVAPVDVESAIRELGQGKFLFPVGSSGLLLGIHELDQESSYRSLAREGLIDRRLLHRRAADYYARSCGERAHWFEWTSNDELKSDIQRFRHLIRAGDTVAAANAMSISKVEFLVWSGHADTIHSMFADLDVGDGDTRAALIKHFALGDALLVSGPFEKAISELKRAIDLAQSLGEAVAEAEATIELGLAYRYVGKSELALSTVHSMIEKLRERGEKRQLAYANSSYSLACTYAGKYLEAIQAGTEQVRYGRHSGESYLVGRGNSCLCLPYYVIGRMHDAARCAKAAAKILVNTAASYQVGFLENVHGLALHAPGDGGGAIQAFDRARATGRTTAQRRVEGLAATNWAWVLYEQGDIEGAALQIAEAIRVFDKISEPDVRLAHHLREAFEYASDGDSKYEAEALWGFIRGDYMNPDLVRGVAVAERILSLGNRVTAGTRHDVESFLKSTRTSLTSLSKAIAELDY